VKEVLLPGGQFGFTEAGQEVDAALWIQKEPLLAWMGPVRVPMLLLKEMSRVKGLAGLWRGSRGAARVDEAVARRAMVFVMVSFMLSNANVMIEVDVLVFASAGLFSLNCLIQRMFCEWRKGSLMEHHS
jgi:hypothetical protein